MERRDLNTTGTVIGFFSLRLHRIALRLAAGCTALLGLTVLGGQWNLLPEPLLFPVLVAVGITLLANLGLQLAVAFTIAAYPKRLLEAVLVELALALPFVLILAFLWY